MTHINNMILIRKPLNEHQVLGPKLHSSYLAKFKLSDASNIVDMSSSEIIRCKECGEVFDTIESLKEHEKSEREDQELQNKRL